ncbi:MAG: N-acetylmuramoyl-L-alanine amidase [Firmicutes bacterium]|nr:N-acetylmuramoyl-L-alanine amidase [Bacillota bacterium]
MTIVVKKRTLLTVVAAIAVAVVIAVSASVGATAASKRRSTGRTVVVDAGHGGRDGGVSGKTTGVKESDINLAIAKSLRHFLERNGYTVIMTRQNSDGLYGMNTQNRKLKDMEARRKIIEDAKPDIVVSIHQNAFPSPTVKGPQVFYAPNSEQGKTAAQTMQNVLNASLGAARTPKTGDFFILQCSSYPSLLVECGFLSNPEEERLLITAAYQEKAAYAIYSGIHNILTAPV